MYLQCNRITKYSLNPAPEKQRNLVERLLFLTLQSEIYLYRDERSEQPHPFALQMQFLAVLTLICGKRISIAKSRRSSVQRGVLIQKERISIRQTRRKENKNKVKQKNSKETGKNSFPTLFQFPTKIRLRSLGENMPEIFQNGGFFGRIQSFSLVVYFAKMYGRLRLGFY